MANAASRNPIYIDTAPFVWQPRADGTPSIAMMKVYKIVWSGQAQAGDEVMIEDAAGHLIWNARAYNTNFQQDTYGGWFNGFQVTRLDSGFLQVYITKT
jgi:hypothetical protein